jgi:hypothetical protein
MTGKVENRDYDIEFLKIKPEDQDFIAMARNVIPTVITSKSQNALEELLKSNF